jgi:hypothetical protein
VAGNGVEMRIETELINFFCSNIWDKAKDTMAETPADIHTHSLERLKGYLPNKLAHYFSPKYLLQKIMRRAVDVNSNCGNSIKIGKTRAQHLWRLRPSWIDVSNRF